MPSHEDIVRAAVQAALRIEATLDPDTAPTCSPTALCTRSSSVAQPTKRSKPKKPSPKPLRAGAPDTNWKKLQKTLVKTSKRSIRLKRPRSQPPRPSPAPTVPDGKFSSFMTRRITSTTELTRVVAIDCEMVGIGPRGVENALARVSVVNYSGDVLYDTFVRVHDAVTDYRTAFSGIRPADVALDNPEAAEPLEAQRAVGELLKGRVLVGHAVRNDLTVLRLKHPKRDVRDTAEYYKRLWGRGGRGRSPALRAVVARVLGVDAFQKEEHDSCEDARAALMLYKKHAREWEKGLREKGGGGGGRGGKKLKRKSGEEEGGG